jgi:hypothetical protein
MNFFENRRKPDPLARQLVEGLDMLKDMSRFKETAFPPNLIFLDNKLKKEQIRQFIDRARLKIIPEDRDRTIMHLEMKSVNKVFTQIARQLCQDGRIIRLYISNEYSIEMPGYIVIPYNFELSEFKAFFELNKNEINKIRTKVY